MTGLALQPVGRHKVRGDDACIQPMATSRRPQWWALELASTATMQPGGNCAHQGRNLSRFSARPVTRWPAELTL